MKLILSDSKAEVKKQQITKLNNFFLSGKSFLERLSLPVRLIRNKILGRIEPVIVILVVNNGCNMRCTYCFGEYSRRENFRDFTTQELKDIIDELYEIGTRNMVVHGGETLLRDDIGEIVDYLKSKPIYISLVTNGVLFPSKINELRGVDNLCISLDGREENNDLNRGKGSFKHAMNAIKLAKSEGFRLRVSATLTRNNRNDIKYLVDLASEMGFILSFSLLYKPMPNYPDLVLDDAEIREILKEILLYKKQGYPIQADEMVWENAINWPFPFSEKSRLMEYEIPKTFKHIPCQYGTKKIIVDADGRVFPCFPLNTTFPAMNLRDVGLKKAYTHILNSERCSACSYLSINEYNMTLGLNPRGLLNQCKVNLKELLKRF